ncbi:MAG TPA: hypothetical protein VGI50_12255 [Solirubrobacteraceae bacterium]
MAVPLACVLTAPASASFGIAGFSGSFTNTDGTQATQAGGHPDVTMSVSFATKVDKEGNTVPDQNVKDIDIELPPGLVGDPQAIPKCTSAQIHATGFLDSGGCPSAAQIGVAEVTVGSFGPSPFSSGGIPVYNMQPPPGVPAQFAFNILGVVTNIDFAVRTGGDNGLTAETGGISQSLPLAGTSVTIWGVPGDPSHDALRYSGPADEGGFPPSASTGPRRALLTAPTSCTDQPLITRLRTDAWGGAPGNVLTAQFDHDAKGNAMIVTGCNRLPFEPTIAVAPDTAQADTPAGLTVEVNMPEGALLNPTGVAPANIQNTTVTLPAGLVINPGQAAGLVACQPGQDGHGTEAAPSCPAASKVGTVQITTPLLTERLEGNVYILPSNPPNLQLLIAVSAAGVNLKLVGDVKLDPLTGQLSATFSKTPQLPFTKLKLSFSGGAQAALSTPPMCGVYSTASDFTPWSAPFGSDAVSADSFSISSGPGGSACASPLPFTPSMIAGSTTDQAAGFTSFSLLLQRADGQQHVARLQFKTPEGLLGMISKIPLCGEPQASQGTCSAASQIGHTVVAAGPGPYPLIVPQPGQPPAPIYLTGSYRGAPYGLSIAVPVIAGPFNLGVVVVRASISVDPHTSQLTVTTDPLPLILGGVPTDLRTINAVIDRPGFMFNPTSCAPMSFGGTATSAEGASASISSRFQVGSCQSLTFKPNFRVTTSGRTSRANGASLDAKVVYPAVAPGNNQASSQSNIAKVKVSLPKQLPSRLTTLQKACPTATFNTNPATCPAGSQVGVARASTPVLPVPLSGPVYFVSKGGEAFPNLIVVLQGYGVRVDLVGDTFISKAGITSSTFKNVPDVPISSFELYLPQGPNSALAANGNLCAGKLSMPTSFVAQDGATIDQSTPIAVSGCAKAKAGKARAARGRHKTARRANRGHAANRRSK